MNKRDDILLPTGTKMNPRAPATAEYYDPGQSMIIIDIHDGPGFTKPKYRCLTTFGEVWNGWEIDTIHSIRHDQTGKILAHTASVVGFVEKGTVYGLVPNRPLPHWVFK